MVAFIFIFLQTDAIALQKKTKKKQNHTPETKKKNNNNKNGQTMTSYDAVRIDIYDAISENDHERIRTLLQQNPDVKWNDMFEISFCSVCPCGTNEIRLSDALFKDKVTIETCRLLFDLGFTGPLNCGFLLSHWFNRRAVRNVFEMCEWYSPAELAQLQMDPDDDDSSDDDSSDDDFYDADVTLIQVSLSCSVGVAYRQLRPRYILWLNMLLRAGCPLSDTDELRLALMDLYVDEATHTVYDALPELQTDVALYRKWYQRFFKHCRPSLIARTEGFGSMAQRRARLRELIALLPLEDIVPYSDDEEESDTDDVAIDVGVFNHWVMS